MMRGDHKENSTEFGLLPLNVQEVEKLRIDLDVELPNK